MPGLAIFKYGCYKGKRKCTDQSKFQKISMYGSQSSLSETNNPACSFLFLIPNHCTCAMVFPIMLSCSYGGGSKLNWIKEGQREKNPLSYNWQHVFSFHATSRISTGSVLLEFKYQAKNF